MNEQELRALVRDAVAKQLGRPADFPSRPVMPPMREPSPDKDFARHISHAIYLIPAESDSGPCLIEPNVPCTHCNFCKSHGH